MTKEEKYNYSNHVKPYSSQFVKVELDAKDIKKAEDFAKQIIISKSKESHHKLDFRSEYKRFYTGTIGELALESYLGIKGIVDWEIGDSSRFHTPDLSGIGIKAGIKTVSYGLFPVVFKNSYSPQIINITWKSKVVYICGLATIKVLNRYQSEELIRDPKLRARGTKTGFYGFKHLRTFRNLEDLVLL